MQRHMMQRIISFSVHQRWLVILLVALVGMFGAWSLTRLPIDAVPDITNNQVQINARAPALSAFEIEKQVTFPIENLLAGIPGLEYTRSLSRNGFAQVTAVFSDSYDIYFARQQVTERLMQARDEFPPQVDTRLGPIATGLSEIYMWTVRYKKFDIKTALDGEQGWQRNGDYLTPEGTILHSFVEKESYLRTVQDWIIRPQLRTVPGVASVDSLGGFVKQYHVQPDPAKLTALGLSFGDLAAVIDRNNLSRGAGYLERNGEGLVVHSGGRLESIDDIRNVVVSTRNGSPVRLGEIATVVIGKELRVGSASMNGDEVVIGTSFMLIGANSRVVSAAVDKKIKQVTKTLPKDIEVRTILNRALLVDATIKTVAKNLLEGAALVILVLFLMLGDFRAALVTATVIPVTMLCLAIGMYVGKISANLMSLGALDFGLIADGAIIVAENSLRRLSESQHKLNRPLTVEERLNTIVDSAIEMRRPTVYGQSIIILVYLPILSFSGVEGKMFHPMAMTVIIALLSEFVLSLTFFPAMIALFVSGHGEEGENKIVSALKRRYEPMLIWAMDHPPKIMAIGLGAFLFAALIYLSLGQEFTPTLDEKNIALTAIRIPSTSLTQSQAMQIEIENVIETFPQVSHVFSKTGTAELATDPMPPNNTDAFIMLKPQHEWPDPNLSKNELIAQIDAAVKKLPGNDYEFTQPIQLRFN